MAGTFKKMNRVQYIVKDYYYYKGCEFKFQHQCTANSGPLSKVINPYLLSCISKINIFWTYFIKVNIYVNIYKCKHFHTTYRHSAITILKSECIICIYRSVLHCIKVGKCQFCTFLVLVRLTKALLWESNNKPMIGRHSFFKNYIHYGFIREAELMGGV